MEAKCELFREIADEPCVNCGRLTDYALQVIVDQVCLRVALCEGCCEELLYGYRRLGDGRNDE